MVGPIMSLMRLLATRLMTILLYTGSVLSLPVCYLPAYQPSSATDEASCPMCRTAGAGHHCTCCDKADACTCQVSSGDQDEPVPRALKPGLPSTSCEVRLTFKSAPLLLPAHRSANTPYLPVLTPPPKSLPF